MSQEHDEPLSNWWTTKESLWMWIVGALAVGAILGFMMATANG